MQLRREPLVHFLLLGAVVWSRRCDRLLTNGALCCIE